MSDKWLCPLPHSMSWGGPATRPRAAQVFLGPAFLGLLPFSPSLSTLALGLREEKPQDISQGPLGWGFWLPGRVHCAGGSGCQAGQGELAVQQGSWLQSARSIPIIALS